VGKSYLIRRARTGSAAVRVDVDERRLLDILKPDGLDLVRDLELLEDNDHLGSREPSNRAIVRAGMIGSLLSKGLDPGLDYQLLANTYKLAMT
jgi:hypothetical protein